MSDMRMFEIYLYRDQESKSGHGGHVRFVAAPDEHAATHKVAYVWGHWWRTCGIREVDMRYWCDTHSGLAEGRTSRELSQQAYDEYCGKA